MPWTAGLDPEKPLVVTHYAGELTPQDLQDAFVGTLELMTSSNRMRLLADCSQLKGGHTIADFYYLADAIAAIPAGRRMREAVLLPALPGSIEAVGFRETTCANRGLNVRVFDQRDAALAWLLE